ncbi:Serine-arginine protein 55 [Trichinella britovi]|uniref:Serine-arginine protein 55 n=1 Tax=Trichinella britovi TaxID=45882 RepID=A0A0V1CBR3_TRIBR|nr:Serine-arginine protein 55 [Trichinella britovi]
MKFTVTLCCTLLFIRRFTVLTCCQSTVNLCTSFWQRWLCVTLVLCEMGTRVYVGRIPYRATERDIEKFFRGFGRIREIFLKNGYGFVEFEHTEDADDACYELNGREMFGERLIVEIARGTPHGRDRYGWRQSYRVRSDRYDRRFVSCAKLWTQWLLALTCDPFIAHFQCVKTSFDANLSSADTNLIGSHISLADVVANSPTAVDEPTTIFYSVPDNLWCLKIYLCTSRVCGLFKLQRSRSRSRSRSRRRSRSRSKHLAFSRDRRRHRRESVSLSRSRSRSRSRSAPPRRKSESPGEDSNCKSPERERNGNGDNSSVRSGSAERGGGYSESASTPRSAVGAEDNGEFEDERE